MNITIPTALDQFNAPSLPPFIDLTSYKSYQCSNKLALSYPSTLFDHTTYHFIPHIVVINFVRNFLGLVAAARRLIVALVPRYIFSHLPSIDIFRTRPPYYIQPFVNLQHGRHIQPFSRKGGKHA